MLNKKQPEKHLAQQEAEAKEKIKQAQEQFTNKLQQAEEVAQSKDAEIERLKAQLEASQAKEAGAELNVPGTYQACNGKSYRFKPGYLHTRMKRDGRAQSSQALIEQANKKDGDPAAKETMEHLVDIGYAGLEEV